MTRASGIILNSSSSLARGKNASMIDLSVGGMMGFSPDYTNYLSNQSYIRKNLFALVVDGPKGWGLLGAAEQGKRLAILKALVELHALSITGLNAGLEVQTSETPVGGSGQTQQHPTNVTEVKSAPVFRWDEKYGMPVFAFLREWISLLIMDPYTKVAGISSMVSNKPADWLADQYGCTIAFIEPDPTHTKVQKSWLCTNMFPLGTGDVVGSRDLTQDSEQTTYDVTFSALTQFGVGVDAFCQSLMDGINITGASPYQRAAFVNQIDSSILATGNGYKSQIEQSAAKSIAF